MKVEIDSELCSGHGRCNTLAANVYRLDDQGYNADRGTVIDIAPELVVSAGVGMRSCPEAAISIIE
jgi:ferredoxin